MGSDALKATILDRGHSTEASRGVEGQFAAAGSSRKQPEAAGGRADPAAPGEDFCRIAIRIGVRWKVGSRILWEGTMCDRGCTDEKSLWAGPMCERGRSDL